MFTNPPWLLSQPDKENDHGRKKASLQVPQQQDDCGVCAGIADYFNIDPSIVRVLWAVLALAAGTGVLAYIACAIILPEGDTEV